MDEANITLVIEAMYQVAADPERWGQVIDALAETPASEVAPTSAARGLAHSQEIAALVGGQASRSTEPVSRLAPLGWVLLTERRRVCGSNPAGRAALESCLGTLKVGDLIQFNDPDNDEALSRALDQAHRTSSRQIAFKLDRDGDHGPCFAYVVPASALSNLVDQEDETPRRDNQNWALLFPAGEEAAKLWASVRESFGLTPAEIRLASYLRDGRTLKDAAEEMSVSINTVRNQLRAIFDKMGLKRQGDLVRALGELSQVSGLLGSDPSVESVRPEDPPPVKTITLFDGRRLAYRDYGPQTGRALLMFHEGMGSSLLPPGVSALARDKRIRVISAERPGFGQSDPRDDYSFDGVADDMVQLCDQLGLGDVHICGILSGAPSAIQTAIRLGTRAVGVLLCSGRPPRLSQQSDGGLVARFRSRLQTHPWVIEGIYNIVRLRMSDDLIQRALRATTAESAGDRAYVEANPWVIGFVAAYAKETLARSARGPVDEMKAFRRSSNMTPAGLTCPLTVWHGEDDHFAPLSDLLDYLGDKVSSIRVVPNSGHLMAIQLWEEILLQAQA
jgi:pimeloyl-ACP methyl ester carboxylesterase/DNA-binding CsgD family transcriptional regulator